MKVIGYLLIAGGLAVLLFLWQTKERTGNLPFSNYTLLVSSWDKYKQKHIDTDGKVVDFEADYVTTSEGQSYALLRSVWMDDKTTFNLVWNWTKNNLKRNDDNLFSWRWGNRQDGSQGVLAGGGENSASDADIDISLALILAGRRWQNQKYIEEARLILEDIWSIETEVVMGKRILAAGNWAISENEIVLNPSYFSPYAYRIFDEVDTGRGWKELIDPTYEILNNLAENRLDKEKSSGLPPDWVTINRKTGQLEANKEARLTTNYGFDAVRVPFRIALDYYWFNEPRAIGYLKKAFTKLEQDWNNQKKLAGIYDHAGKVLSENESAVSYSTALSYFQATNPEKAKELYQKKILTVYSNDQNTFRDDLPYYDQNWLWFGAGLFNGFLKMYE